MASNLIEIDSKELDVFIKSLEKIPNKFDTRKVVTDSANFLSARMKTRTKSGTDRDNSPFEPYSDSYKKFRAKKGRRAQVDLTFSGQMIASISATTKSDVLAVVRIADAIQQKKAIIHQLGLGVMPKRPFFGISDKDTVAIRGVDKIFERELDKRLKELN